jgi:hypothetical protein
MIKRFRGDSHSIHIKLSQNGVPVDLTGVSKTELAIQRENVIGGAEGSVDIFLGIDNADPVTGLVEFKFVDTSFTEIGTFNYDVQVTWSDLTKTTFIKSAIVVEADINRT